MIRLSLKAEVELTLQRVNEGVDAARGRQGGRPRVDKKKTVCAMSLCDTKQYIIEKIEEMSQVSS